MKDPLFEPIRINRLTLKNRIYLPAMHLGMCEEFLVNDRLVAFYAERAKGGAGMIVVGNATVDECSGNSQYIGAHLDAHLPGLTRLAAAIHENGAHSAVQLNHAGRYCHSVFLDGRAPVAPSAIASSLTGEVPEALTLEGIRSVVASFADAAARVKKAGFSAVEVLSGTGYLISEFLSPLTNTRDDAYGGPLENRMRLGLEIMGAIRQRVGADYPLLVRMDNHDFMEGGMPREELETYAQRLVSAGVDALCIKGGWHEARTPQLTPNVPRGVYGYLARNVKERVSVPVIASHRINDPAIARELIGEGWCDMVAMGRSLIADPFLPEKARTGREREIVHCIACAQGCFDHLFQLKHVECLCNPRAGHEEETRLVKSPAPKKVMIIGGGAAGMTAALAAHEKGHQVTLYEKAMRLGGQLHLAAAPPRPPGVSRAG
ncbi:NADH:flavin oxidoreductase [Desulfoluna sp.]|uniref:NADH:flavin oxidoreductase n=1 Tax=Desulfoluna sp. TaxID=2045199 RepID=UPI00260F6F6E|nr:NADH:flavin oxidoreductase [Desulfoluna sp.]